MSYSIELRNAKLAANTAVIGNAGRVEIYAGTDSAGPANSEGTLLAVFTMGSPFAPAPVNGVLTATIPATVNAVATGTAGWARITKSDGTTQVMDRTVGVSGAQVNLSTLNVVAGLPLSLTSLTIADGNV